jgi:hypothetical protein
VSKPSFVPIAFKNAFRELEDVLPAVLAAPKPFVEHYRHISLLYRRLAVGALLTSGDPRDFFGYLARSARAFLHFAEIAPPAERVTSKADAFFDALACRDEEGARRLAAALPSSPNPDREYEEDFYYVRCVMDIYGGAKPGAAVTDMLKAWTTLAVDPDLRADLCSALLDRDQDRFDDALAACIEARQADLARRKEQDKLPPDEASTTAHVSTEVLAWLELAERAGLRVAPEYPFAPGIARRFRLAKLPPPQAWRAL